MADEEQPSHSVIIQGKTYDVYGASDIEVAKREAQKFRQDELNKQYIENANQTPEWAKPLMAIQDATLSGIDTMSAGTVPAAVDWATGTDAATGATAASRNRMGWAAPAMDLGMFARAIPSAVAPAVKYMGGGKVLKNVVGGGVATAEGGAYGATEAATHDQDPRAGGAVGAGGGLLGHTLPGLYNQAAKWWKGVDDIPAATKVVTGQGMPAKPTRAQVQENKIEGAYNAAQQSTQSIRGGSLQDEYAKVYEKLATGQTKDFTPTQIALMNKIYQGDPAIKASRAIGDALSNKIAAAGVGGVAGYGVNPIAGMALGGGMLAAGKAASALSRTGTEEAVQNLRRTMAKHPKFIGPISNEEKARLAKMGTVGLLDYYNQ